MKSVRETLQSRSRRAAKEGSVAEAAAPDPAPPSAPAQKAAATKSVAQKAAAPKAPPAPEPPETLEDEAPASEPPVSAASAHEVASPDASQDLTPVVGVNLRRLRVKRGLSLEKLSRASNVSRAMLGQIELGQSTPTINVLWKIARALGVPFSALITSRGAARTTVMAKARAKVLTSHDGAFSSRALFPFDEPRTVEFYELKLAPRSVESADPHPPGTVENLVVTSGSLEMIVAGEKHALGTGDSILFEADVPHQYRNAGDSELVMYLVMTYAEKNA